MCDEFDAAVEVLDWMINVFPHFIRRVISIYAGI